jgi:hypothetical protein
MNFLIPQGFSFVYFNSPILSEGTGAAGGTGLSEPYPDGKPSVRPQITGSGKYYYHYFCYNYRISQNHHHTMS